MNNLEELKKAALGANLHGWTGFEDALNADGYSEAVSKFIQHCSPSVILKLIASQEAANEKLSKPVVLSSSTIMSRACAVRAIKEAGFTVKEDATPIVIVPEPAGVIMRPQFEKPLELCAAGRDGECHHKDCPQLRDNEPMATGRHCPIDNWDDE